MARLRNRVAWALAPVAGLAALGWSAREAESGDIPLAVLDTTVGLAFVAAAGLAGGTVAERGWFAGVGATWLLGALPGVLSVHQGLLLVALAAFPSGRIRHPSQWLVTVLAVPIALGLVNQLGVAASFALCAVGAALSRRHQRLAGLYPAASSAGVAAALGAAWAVSRARPDVFDPTVGLVAYEVVLLVVAVGFPFGVRADARAQGAMADRMLIEAGPGGLGGLEAVLRDLFNDPELRVSLAAPEAATAGPRTLAVEDESGPVAVVNYTAAGLDDEVTAAAVRQAVRLTVTHERRQRELAARIAELEAARARIVAAADRQRELTAAELRDDIGSLSRALADVRTTRADADADAHGGLDLVTDEVAAAMREIADLVAGAPPVLLGDGRLESALTELAWRCPIPVSVQVTADARADQAVETAMFYVCSETLVNAATHTRATAVEVTLDRVGADLTLTVSDNGGGGADPHGSGLQGLADRLATLDGSLQVESPPGGCTTVTATVPVTRSSARD